MRIHRPPTSARRALLRGLLTRRAVASQEELVALLRERGHTVTQTTVSRDLAALGAGKVVGEDGGVRYALPGDGEPVGPDALHDDLERRIREFVTAIDHSGNLAVVKTLPGGAGPVASALDARPPAGVLGTVAGDDTILVVTRDLEGGAALARRLETIWTGTPADTTRRGT